MLYMDHTNHQLGSRIFGLERHCLIKGMLQLQQLQTSGHVSYPLLCNCPPVNLAEQYS